MIPFFKYFRNESLKNNFPSKSLFGKVSLHINCLEFPLFVKSTLCLCKSCYYNSSSCCQEYMEYWEDGKWHINFYLWHFKFFIFYLLILKFFGDISFEYQLSFEELFERSVLLKELFEAYFVDD